MAKYNRQATVSVTAVSVRWSDSCGYKTPISVYRLQIWPRISVFFLFPSTLCN